MRCCRLYWVVVCCALATIAGCDWHRERQACLRDGLSLLAEGRRAAAAKRFERALELDPYHAEANAAYAACLATMPDRTEDAFAALQRCRALGFPPDGPGARWRDSQLVAFQSICDGRLEDPADAVRDFIGNAWRRDADLLFARMEPGFFLTVLHDTSAPEGVIGAAHECVRGMTRYTVHSRLIRGRRAGVRISLDKDDGARIDYLVLLSAAEQGYWQVSAILPLPAGSAA